MAATIKRTHLKIAGISFLILASMCTSVPKPRSVYISPIGSDDNTGTIMRPFKTIVRARDEVRKLLSANTAGEIVVYLRSGNYYVENTIRFDENDSRSDAAVTYKGYKKEKVKIYGGIPVTNWTLWKDKIYRAKVPQVLKGRSFYRFFVDDKGAEAARYPNSGDGFGKGLKKINNTTVEVPKEWKDYDFSNARITGWIGANWHSDTRKVQSFDKDKLQLTIDSISYFYGGLNNRIFICGVPELLDTEGEWCLNTKDGYTYYYPVEGKFNPDKTNTIVPLVRRILDIHGSSPEKRVSNLSFENITFIGSDFTDNWKEDVKQEEGMIYIENAENISIKYCEIAGAGFNGVFINNWSQKCKVYGCSISDAGNFGVFMNSSVPVSIQSTDESYINKYHLISNNFMHDCGKFVGSGAGIDLYQSGDNRITNNEICRMPRYGIAYGGNGKGDWKEMDFEKYYDYTYTRNNLVAYNDVYNVDRNSNDYGGIESWMPGKNNVWYNNVVHDITQPLEWDTWAHALFADDGSGYLTIKNNIVYEIHGGTHTGAVMVKAISDLIQNNILADNPIGRVITTGPYNCPVADNIIRKNIMYYSGTDLYEITEGTLTYYPGKGRWDNEKNRKKYAGRLAYHVNGNLVYPQYVQLDTIKKYGWDTNTITADPLFDKKNPPWDITYKDYKLKENSPAWKMGFRKIAYDSIGLLNDFPFNRMLVKDAGELIQAEDFNRIKDLRLSGETNIYNTKPGSWAKYENVDFGNGKFKKFKVTIDDDNDKISTGCCLFEIRLDAPTGKLIGQINKGDTDAKITKVRGLHNLFLVFKNDISLNSFRFHK